MRAGEFVDRKAMCKTTIGADDRFGGDRGRFVGVFRRGETFTEQLPGRWQTGCVDGFGAEVAAKRRRRFGANGGFRANDARMCWAAEEDVAPLLDSGDLVESVVEETLCVELGGAARLGAHKHGLGRHLQGLRGRREPVPLGGSRFAAEETAPALIAAEGT
jgi:hypothetical protein